MHAIKDLDDEVVLILGGEIERVLCRANETRVDALWTEIDWLGLGLGLGSEYVWCVGRLTAHLEICNSPKRFERG